MLRAELSVLADDVLRLEPQVTATEPCQPRPRRPGRAQVLEPDGTEGAGRAMPGSFTVIDRQGCEVLFRPLSIARRWRGCSGVVIARRGSAGSTACTPPSATSELDVAFDLDYRDRFGWAVEIACDGLTTPVAVGRYARDTGSRRVDVGITMWLSSIIG